MNNLVSIITPAYNAEKYIKDTIESVIAQTYENWEMIIVDDASKDNTVNIIKNYQQKDRRIKLISLNENQGVANARNIAIQNAKGIYIAFLDADDIWEKDKLKKQIQIIKSTNADITYTAYKMIDETGKTIKRRSVKKEISLNDLLKENSIIFSSVLCKKERINNKYFVSKWYHEDYVFLLDLAKEKNKFCGINESLMEYRVHQKSRSFNKSKAAKYRWKIYREYLNFSFLKAMYFMIFYFIYGIRKYF